MREEVAPISGPRIAEVREQVRPRISQARLAKAIGKSQSWLSNLENDYQLEPIKDVEAQAIADRLGVLDLDVLREAPGTPIRWRAGEIPVGRAITNSELTRLLPYWSQLGEVDRAFLIEAYERQARLRLEEAAERRRAEQGPERAILREIEEQSATEPDEITGERPTPKRPPRRTQRTSE